MKRIIAIVLSISMLFGFFSDDKCRRNRRRSGISHMRRKLRQSPTIIIHGIMQSTVAYLDENGNYIKETANTKSILPEVDVKSLVKNQFSSFPNPAFAERLY